MPLRSALAVRSGESTWSIRSSTGGYAGTGCRPNTYDPRVTGATKECVVCHTKLPSVARFCAACGATQPAVEPGLAAGQATARTDPAPDTGEVASRRRIRWPFLLVPLVVIATGAAAWYFVPRMGGSSGAGDRLSNVTAVLDTSRDGEVDVYLVEAGELLEREARVLSDVSIGGTYTVVEGTQIVSFDPFDLAYEGGALFAYRDEPDDDWMLAIARRGDEVIDLVDGAGTPRVLISEAGAFVTFNDFAGSCEIFRLDGLEVQRLARTDECGVSEAVGKIVLIDRSGSGAVVSILDLATGEETEPITLDDGTNVNVYFDATGATSAVREGKSEITLIDLVTGDPIVREDGYLLDHSQSSLLFFSYLTVDKVVVQTVIDPESEIDLSTARIQTNPFVELGHVVDIPVGTELALATPESTGVVLESSEVSLSGEFNPIGTHFFVVEYGGGEGVFVSVGEAATRNAVEAADFGQFPHVSWIDSERFLIVSADGEILLVGTDGSLNEVGNLDVPGDRQSITVTEAAGLHLIEIEWLDGTELGRSVGILDPGGDGRLIPVEELAASYTFTVSPDKVTVVATGVEDWGDSTQILLAIDMASAEIVVLDDAEGFDQLQIVGGSAYYTASTGNEPNEIEARRVMLSGTEQPVTLYEEAQVYVPSTQAGRDASLIDNIAVPNLIGD